MKAPRGTIGAWLAVLIAGPAFSQPSFVAFESDQVRPLAVSPDQSRLFAVNTPDNRLEVFRITTGRLVHEASIPVGMEPVAVALRSADEAWVVNHVSDSVSIVDVTAHPPRVIRTLLVGDEPRDVVFAGPANSRAFITTAHRGQNSPFPLSEFTTPGVGRADVWVFDAMAPGTSPDGDPITVVTLFGDRPRALTVSPDGSRVYAAVFRSGNQTTIVGSLSTCPGGSAAAPCTLFGGEAAPGGAPPPGVNHQGFASRTGLIVKFDPGSGQWLDELGRDWSGPIKFDLPDLDVFAIDANADPPVEMQAFAGVGTILFNMIVNPVNGKVYVTNTEARNEVRFEGPGIFAASFKPPGEPASVRGHLHEARITILDGTSVQPRHLNKHIPYAVSPVPAGVKERSLATPMGMAVSGDGNLLFVAAFGSSKIGIFETAALENDTFVPDAGDHIELAGGGPSGLALDEGRGRLYVLTRFDNAVAVIDLATRAELERVRLHNPEPAIVIDGRPFLYDARLTSSNGEASCAACHVSGDMDDLAWDLGNPDGDRVPNPNPLPATRPPFHPMKGPFTTQTLRGLATHGPMHWRGDRTGGNADPPGDPLDETLAFKAFNVAFDGLLGRDEGPLTEAQMQAFTDFALELMPPPNPIRQLDGALREDEQRGRDIFFTPGVFQLTRACNDCHVLDPAIGFFGTSGLSSDTLKVPHLRNAYQKIGMFGMPLLPLMFPGNNEHTGEQVRGYGFSPDGSMDTVAGFLKQLVFVLDETGRRDLEAFVMAFDSNLAAIVGQQITLSGTNAGGAAARVDLLAAQAGAPFAMLGHPDATACDLVVKGVIEGEARGWVRTPTGTFRSDRAAEPELGDAALRELAATADHELTFTCAPPGSGVRMGIDRDEDGFLDRDELDAFTDPDDPASNLGACPPGPDSDGDGLTDGCDPSPFCPQAPVACTEGDGARLWLHDRNADGSGSGDRLAWQWRSGAAVDVGDFGDPTASTTYALCIYTGVAARLSLAAQIPPGQMCGGRPCWMPIGSRGFHYRAADGRSGERVSRVLLRGGASQRSRIVVRGRGGLFNLAGLPVDTSAPVEVRLHNSATAACWGATFEVLSVQRDTTETFRANR